MSISLKLKFVPITVLVVCHLGCVRQPDSVGMAAEPATASVAKPTVNPAIGEEEKKTLERFFHRILDLSRPELAPIREAVEKQNYAVAAELYQRRFIDNIGRLELGKPWVYYTANSAADLMADTVKWKKGWGRIEHYHLGSPGSYLWWPATMNGQFNEWTEVHRMNFTHVLPNKFVKTGDVDYMSKWGVIWSDFIDNNFRQWKALMSDRRAARDAYGPAVGNPWKHMLYIMWRVDSFVQQLGVAAKYSPEKTISAVSAAEFIKMLVFMHDQCDSLKSQLRPGSTPNQLNGCSAKLLRAAMVFDDFQDSPAWREAVDRAWTFTLNEGAVLPDGSDVEMSFGYLPQIIYSPYRMLPFFPVGELPGWMDDLMRASQKRFRFLACATSPSGFLPNLATEPGRNRKEDWYRLQLETNRRDPLIGRILNQIWGEDATVPEPAFTSTAFPYGGSYVLRNGWKPGSHYLYFNAARNGRGHKDNCGNAVILEAFGRKLLVDSGTYRVLEPFPEKKHIRRYLTSSFAHNTISVDGEALLTRELDGGISGVVLNCRGFELDGTPQTVGMSDFAFTVVGNRLASLREINSPTGFAWQETAEGPVPVYDQAPPEPARAAAPENLAQKAKISFTSFEGEDPAAIAAHLLDGNPDTGWQAAATDPLPAIIIEFDSDTTFDMVRVREPSTDRTFTITGAAILDYTIDAWQSGQWRRLAYGESVYPRYESNSHGEKSEYFTATTARKLRILIRKSQRPPSLSEIGVYRVTSSKLKQEMREKE